jgi:hypothetical protein
VRRRRTQAGAEGLDHDLLERLVGPVREILERFGDGVVDLLDFGAPP